jgi:hypothetical protein
MEIKMNEIKVFQTGRHYSEKGQRIAYTVVDGWLLFADVDRGIDGCFNIDGTDNITHRDVLRLYDKGGYGGMSRNDQPIRDALWDKASHF